MEEVKVEHKEEVLALDKALTLMERVRKECPWDRSQTNDTLRTLTIEEMYELSQAILDKKDDEICKELGDVLMHIIFYALIGKEKNKFTIIDVANSLSEKLIRRHPHVFGGDNKISSEEVEKNWERIKLKEGNRSTFSGVPETLPSLIKAYRLQDKAKGIGFDWKSEKGVREKIHEEIEELEEELKQPNNNEKITEEFGDVLFSLINYARFIDVNPDTALEKTNRKFKRRFEYMENKATEKGTPLYQLNIDQMEELWQQAKKEEKQSKQ